MKKIFFYFTQLLFLPLILVSQDFSTKSTALTIYQNNFGSVQQNIEFKLSNSPATFSFVLPSLNVITSSIFLNFDGEVLEQSYIENLGIFDDWKKNSLGKEITIITSNGQTHKGKLTRFENDEIVLNTNDGNSVYLKDLEGVTVIFNNYQFQQQKKPEIKWLLKPKKLGTNTATINFHCNGINWYARYFAFLDDAKQTMNLYANASITNQSGIDFEDIKLKIIEGELNLQERFEPKAAKTFTLYQSLSAAEAPSGYFEPEQSVFEYYQYEYPNKVSLKNNENKSLQLFAAEKVPYKKVYSYNLSNYPPLDRKDKPAIFITFKNTKENNLGRLLPKGLVDFYESKMDKIEFIGQSAIRTVPIGDETKLFIGNATDLAVEVKNADQITIGENRIERNFKLICYNFKNKEATIEISYYSAGQTVELIKTNIQPKEKLPTKLLFDVPIKANSQTVLSFTIQAQK